MAHAKVMVVDDDREIAELIRDYLEAEQFEVILCGDGRECVRMFRECRPQLLVLDIMLPGLDGMEVCRTIRAESNIPIIMLSAKQSEVDKILGLGLGADDYVVKPFSPGEVVARVKAQLRRYHHLSAPDGRAESLRFGDLDIDPKAYMVRRRGRIVPLTTKEFEVLRFLAQHPNQALSRQQIYDHVWGFHEYGDLNTVTIHVKKIREKIEDDPANPRYIKTVWGIGYRFEGDAP
jgi:DNA-binding response OmpR family regulator